MDDFYYGMTNKERESYSKEYLINFKNRLEQGEVTENEYSEFYIRYLINLVKKTVHEITGLPFTDETYKDLVSECTLEIIAHIKEYNPNETEPSTYFLPYIRKRILDYTQKSGVSDYYNSIIRKLNKAAREHGYDGMDDERLSIQQLSIISGERLSTIIEAKEQAQYKVSSWEDLSDKLEDDKYEYGKNPEDRYIEKEEKETLWSAFDNLTRLEKFLYAYTKMEGASLRKALNYLKRPENLARFAGEVTEKTNQAQLQRILNRSGLAMRKVLTNTKKPRNNSRRRYNNELVEQAFIQDFMDGSFE